ncbi:MAG: ABC transporter substrate-binding protein [Microbacterium sp.]
MVSELPQVAAMQIWDSLVLLRGDQFEQVLAESIVPNDDGSEWTITLHEGIEFHDGTPLTADDVLYSLGWLAASDRFSALYVDYDPEASHVVDDHTVVAVMKRPRADFIETSLALGSYVIKAGMTDLNEGNGTGAYKLESFSADEGTVLVKNENYWRGEPEIGRIELVPIADPATRATALTDGRVDFALGVTSTAAETIKKSEGFEVQYGGTANSSQLEFSMNTRIAPFDDPAVRQALRDLVDRQQLVDVVFRGDGEVGNDLPGLGLPGYPDRFAQAEPDVQAAREVFEREGITELNVLVAEALPGITDATELVKQQLAEVGVQLTLEEVDPATLYSDIPKIQSAQLFATYVHNRPLLSHSVTFLIADSPYNWSGWVDPEFNEAINTLQTVSDPAIREEALTVAQNRIHASTGSLIWGFQEQLNGAVAPLEEVPMTQSLPLFWEVGYEQ